MFHVITGLIGLYIIARFVPPLPYSSAWKWLIVVLVLVVSQYYLINQLFMGGMGSPEVSSTYIIVGGWIFGSFILMAGLLLIKDIVSLIFWLGYKFSLLSVPISFGYKTVMGICGLSLLLSAIGVHQATKIPDTKRVEITLERLPAELDGLRIVQLTDLHASRLFQEPWIRTVVNKTNCLNPDLVVITGDLVDGTPENRALDVAPLPELKARLGVYVVTGNHEYYSNHVRWMRTFENLGLNILRNSHVVLSSNGKQLVLAGITDRIAARFGLPEPDIQAALKGKPENVPTVLLAHQPKDADTYARSGVDLQLSGHTHGGQILGMHWITQLANSGFVSGLYETGNMMLYVSNGTALWNGFPVRLGKPSEITEIVLHSPVQKHS